VALLDVPEPERLAREAFALLEQIGACVGIAVVVYSASGALEILACVGWDKTRAAEVCVSMPGAIVRLGQSGDREFGLAVELAAQPSSRSALESVRKLIAASLALNQSRDPEASTTWQGEISSSHSKGTDITNDDPDTTLEGPRPLAERTPRAEQPSPIDEVTVRMDQPLTEALAIVERAMVRRALERTHGRVEEAARLLGISRKGLFLKRRRWAGDRRQVS
jgi:hypothetical protein